MMFCAAATAPGDNMHFHIHLHAAHAEGLLDAFLSVYAELLFQDMQNLLITGAG